MPRLFIAIPLPETAHIATLQGMLKAELRESRINWVPPANFHITLKFLGDVEPYFLNSIQLALQQVAAETVAFSLEETGPGYFGSLRQPSVIWYGYTSSPVIRNLARSLNDSLYQVGLPREEKPFRTHLTLARVKTLKETDAFRNFMERPHPTIKEPVHIDSFTLFESHLHSGGAVYTEAGRYELRGA
ncbi:MAG: RNA 2',3'-cyclic phosphodiesterase [Bacteroidales bacterium]|nr:RNA 2',3'-cyclic phosphodiesterase [Bacteroidales bacterium]